MERKYKLMLTGGTIFALLSICAYLIGLAIIKYPLQLWLFMLIPIFAGLPCMLVEGIPEGLPCFVFSLIFSAALGALLGYLIWRWTNKK